MLKISVITEPIWHYFYGNISTGPVIDISYFSYYFSQPLEAKPLEARGEATIVDYVVSKRGGLG